MKQEILMLQGISNVNLFRNVSSTVNVVKFANHNFSIFGEMNFKVNVEFKKKTRQFCLIIVKYVRRKNRDDVRNYK